ncbi:AbiJ-NTD4 domain-containing protein [Burkholderia pyrrocinia]
MLTDVFFRRYENRPMFKSVGQKESVLFVQVYRIVDEQIWKYYGYNKVDERVKTIWTVIHDRLTMEIGIKELSPKFYSYQTEWMGKPSTASGWNDMNFVVEQWLNYKFTDDLDPDMFVKRRLSFVELAFRTREEQVAQANAEFPLRLAEAEMQGRMPQRAMTLPGTRSDSVRAINEGMNRMFAANVHELNERLKQAGMPLHYHNGYLQITQDEQFQEQVEQPFWLLVRDAQWKNVSIDMAEAIDRRDTGGRDPSFYAAKALESTIKIICELKKWTTGAEKGVSDFLNHLESKGNGAFIEGWERQSMQRFYSDVRNDLGHGPGSKDMPNFTAQQIDQTIEFCMSWVKSLIKRL